MTEFNHKLKNLVHMLALFLCMGAILSLLGFILAGVNGILWAAALGVLILVISPNISPSFIFSMYGGRLLSANDAPGLYRITQELASRADLPAPPELYYLPSQLMNAFSVGTSANSAIGLSDSLLNTLTMREIIAVLAHEISHIQHNDVRVMTYADILNRITNTLSLTGFLLVFLNLPLYFLGWVTISWFALGVLIVAPGIMSFLQLSLSRMKEFDADRQAILLTDDPEGLAMALAKLEFYESSILDMLFGRGHRGSIPSVLRTHPGTEERIKRLLSFKKPTKQAFRYSNHDRFSVPVHYQKSIRKPRWHLGGFWY
ncbi:MAG: zinc metalloprotease HtpX [Methylobacter sp.]|uniref:zinc metalloprotease HtpX n=1 Tax=Methylobacter sp. TaxID=2051955 RepID=UPI00273174B4|nr:zinc metalloprotease HtpX [Methylobacter sp.]MDP1665036.1 zinc metalloprotease HtpX [Methylobacter sp.]MDP1971253.1 zinc metalloprotease HtpX [Methylobacter sp.]